MEVLLCASVPLPDRNPTFFKTADVLAIREAIKAVVEVVLPKGRITCGGHPAITPLLALFAREAQLPREKITIFQSQLFINDFPPELNDFVDVRIIPMTGLDCQESLSAMRRSMVSSRKFTSAIFVGGMDGLFEELSLFQELHPGGKIIPLATTGAAAAQIFTSGQYDPGLATARTYPSVLRRSLF